MAEQCRPAEESRRDNIALLEGLSKIFVITKAVAVMSDCSAAGGFAYPVRSS